MDAHGETLTALASGQDTLDLEAVFAAHYARIARVLARVVRDRARAEELAVDVFLKWSRHPKAHGPGAAGWLFRTAIRMGLDELRREARRARFEPLMAAWRRAPATPEDVRATNEEQRRVRAVLAALRPRDAALLLLRSQDLSYEEIAGALSINAASIGTLLRRAQQQFKNTYVRRYGHD